MAKWIKVLAAILLGIVLVLGGAMGFFIYKVKYGIATYETDPPELTIPEGQFAVLLFSKTTGFRHGESIDASKEVFRKMADENNWFLYETEDAGIINAEQLNSFEVIVWNNSTGRCLTDGQRETVEQYVEAGGGMIGIHGAGDDSHHWAWYEANLLGARFSHHPIENQFQEAQLSLEALADTLLMDQLPQSWSHEEEWYVFHTNPRENNFKMLYTINGESIDPNGNVLWIKDKDFGMGKDHPVAWYNFVGRGRTFYTSLGHMAEAWNKREFVRMIENALKWSGARKSAK